MNRLFDESKYSLWFVAFVALIFYGQHIWVPGFSPDGYIYIGLTTNTPNGHWLVPSLTQSNYLEFFMHPPLAFILQGWIYKFVDANSWVAARLISISWALATIILISWFITKYASRSWGFWTGIVLALMPHFTKIARTPNLDVPLTFFMMISVISYYLAFLDNKKRWWFISGVSLGLALLIKGPPAFSVVIAMFFHLLLTGNIKRLMDWKPWCGLLSGLLVFGMWPLVLYFNDKLYVFSNYLYGQIYITLGRSRERTDWALHTYFYHMLKTSAPWFILSMVGVYQIFKKRKVNALAMLFWCSFLSIMIPYSFVRWKYSHYIIPAYPAYAALTGFVLASFSNKVQNRINFTIKSLVYLAVIVILMFPLTTTSRRDESLIKVCDLVSSITKEKISWSVVDNSYNWRNIQNFISWRYHSDPFMHNQDDVRAFINGKFADKKWVFFMPPTTVALFEKEFGDTFSTKLKKLAYFKKKNFIVLIDRSLLSEAQALLNY